MGMWHEQSRPDRDDFINVHYENILDDFTDQYDKIQDTAWDDQKSPYDTESVMHYS